MKFKSNTGDPLVFQDEYRDGLKEEMEHSKTVNGDKNTIKKIVLDHLVEDPHYYSKLKSVMKAEEEKSIINFKKPEGTKIPKEPGTPKQQIDSLMHLTQKKAEEEFKPTSKDPSKKDVAPSYKIPVGLKGEADILGRGPSGLPTVKDTNAFNVHSKKIHDKAVSTLGKTAPHTPLPHMKAEEDSDKEKMKSTMGFIKHQDADRTRARQNQMKTNPLKADEDVCDDCGKKLSTSLIEKAEEELGKDKVEEARNKTVVEDFAKAEEEKSKQAPARFEAEPAQAGIGDIVKKILDPRPPKLNTKTTPPLTKSVIRRQSQHA